MEPQCCFGTCVLIAALVLAGASAGASPGISTGAGVERGLELVVEAPAELEATAQRVQRLEPERLAVTMELLGIDDPGGPIRILLFQETSPAARQTPPWIAGYAYGALGTVVLFPARTPTYPHDSLEELVRHEIAHVLLARAAAGGRVPRWFNEGVAMLAGGPWGLGDRSRLTLALVREEAAPLAELDRLFGGTRAEVSRGYALAGAFVRHLTQRFGRQAIAATLAGVAAGLPFEIALERATGRRPGELEASFWRRESIWYRWIPFLTSSFTLWVGITLLALVAAHRRRQRDAELRRLWEEEERQLAAVLLAEPGPPDRWVN